MGCSRKFKLFARIALIIFCTTDVVRAEEFQLDDCLRVSVGKKQKPHSILKVDSDVLKMPIEPGDEGSEIPGSAIHDPRSAASTLLRNAATVFDHFGKTQEASTKILEKFRPGYLKDAAAYLKRAADVVFNVSDSTYTLGTVWKRNNGIDAFNSKNLSDDPIFRKIASQVLRNIAPYDKALNTALQIYRAKNGYDSVAQGFQVTDLLFLKDYLKNNPFDLKKVVTTVRFIS